MLNLTNLILSLGLYMVLEPYNIIPSAPFQIIFVIYTYIITYISITIIIVNSMNLDGARPRSPRNRGPGR